MLKLIRELVMFEHYWNSASLLRASLISAGIPEDAAQLVTSKTRDNTEVWSTFILAGLFVSGAALAMVWLAYALCGFASSRLGLSPSVISICVPEPLFVTAVMAGNLLVARIWAEYRYLIFIYVALNQSTLGIGKLFRAAIRRASDGQGADYVRKVVRWPGQVLLCVCVAATVTIACLSLL